MMAKIYIFVVLFVAVEYAQMQNTSMKFRQLTWKDLKPVIFQVACTKEADRLFNEAVEEAKCGTPKDVWIELRPPSKLEKVTPAAVWVKRCVGTCDFESDIPSATCAPISTSRSVHTRIFNVKTGKDRCATYEVEEHTSCSCPTSEDERSFVYTPQEPVYREFVI